MSGRVLAELQHSGLTLPIVCNDGKQIANAESNRSLTSASTKHARKKKQTVPTAIGGGM